MVFWLCCRAVNCHTKSQSLLAHYFIQQTKHLRNSFCIFAASMALKQHSFTTYVLTCLMLFLNVALPVAFNYYQQSAQEVLNTSNTPDSPYADPIEEKAPVVNFVLAEEYVHESHLNVSLQSSDKGQAFIHANNKAYRAYHGDLLCPPPNQLV